MTVTQLMQPSTSPPHWTDLALCEGDKRFTQDETLTDSQVISMAAICKECEVFFECLEEHDPHDEPDYRAIGVFAAGEYFDYEEIP